MRYATSISTSRHAATISSSHHATSSFRHATTAGEAKACRGAFRGALALLLLVARLAGAQEVSAPPAGLHQSLDDAWWTGPMLAPSAATLPQGHILVEPYLYDVTAHGRFDAQGVHRGGAYANGFGSLTYALYGLADRLTVGLIPTAGFNTVSGGPSSSHPGPGDLSAVAQYRLTQFREGGWLPTTSAVVQESLPTGKYDRLGERPSDGLGSGARATTVALYSQTYFWLPNGRIFRARLDLSQSFSRAATVDGVSVYGTPPGFHGHARPGAAFVADASGEYSLTRSWVLALDVAYRHDRDTRVNGFDFSDPASTLPPVFHLDAGPSDTLALAPALEYNFTSRVGVLLGARLTPAGRRTAATLTPALAINIVH